MRGSRLVRFLTVLAVLDGIALTLGALFAPPDPATQVAVVGPMLVVAPVIAYWLVYVRNRPSN